MSICYVHYSSLTFLFKHVTKPQIQNPIGRILIGAPPTCREACGLPHLWRGPGTRGPSGTCLVWGCCCCWCWRCRTSPGRSQPAWTSVVQKKMMTNGGMWGRTQALHCSSMLPLYIIHLPSVAHYAWKEGFPCLALFH